MLGSAQVRACFAKKTVLCGKGFWAKCSGPHGSRRICRRNRGPCQVFGLMLGFAATVLRAGSWAKCLGPREADLGARGEADLHGCSHDRFAKRMFMQQMAPDIFVRIGGLQKKARTACEWHSQLDDSIGNTPTTVSWRFEKIFAKQRLLLACPISPAHFRDRKTLRNVCIRRGLPVGAALGKNAASFNLIV